MAENKNKIVDLPETVQTVVLEPVYVAPDEMSLEFLPEYAVKQIGSLIRKELHLRGIDISGVLFSGPSTINEVMSDQHVSDTHLGVYEGVLDTELDGAGSPPDAVGSTLDGRRSPFHADMDEDRFQQHLADLYNEIQRQRAIDRISGGKYCVGMATQDTFDNKVHNDIASPYEPIGNEVYPDGTQNMIYVYDKNRLVNTAMDGLDGIVYVNFDTIAQLEQALICVIEPEVRSISEHPSYTDEDRAALQTALHEDIANYHAQVRHLETVNSGVLSVLERVRNEALIRRLNAEIWNREQAILVYFDEANGGGNDDV